MDQLTAFLSSIQETGEKPEPLEPVFAGSGMDIVETVQEVISAHSIVTETFQPSACSHPFPEVTPLLFPLRFNDFISSITAGSISDLRQSLRARTIDIARQIAGEYNLPETSAHLKAISPVCLTVFKVLSSYWLFQNDQIYFGKILTEHPDIPSFDPSSVLLEGLDGHRIPLLFHVPFNLFPGQIVAIRGSNSLGNQIHVHEFIDVWIDLSFSKLKSSPSFWPFILFLNPRSSWVCECSIGLIPFTL